MNERSGTTERLLNAAIELLDAGGESAVRVDVVAEASGVSRPTIYHHFQHRDGLIVAAQAERYRRTLLFGLSAQYQAVRALETREQFADLVSSWMRQLGSEDGIRRRSIRMQVLGSAATRAELRTLVRAVDREAARQIALVIAVAQDRGWTGYRFEPEVAALWWYGMMNGRFIVEHSPDEAAEPDGAELAVWDEIATEAVLRLFGGLSDT